MRNVLGIDTSNYTTSAALLNTDDMSVFQSKMLLPVKPGELGIRQSDAVFHHTKQLPLVLSQLIEKTGFSDLKIKAVGVSKSPRLVSGSYMPCFLAGDSFADSYSKLCRIDLYKTSHQIGHILAALYSCGRLDLIFNKKSFVAFHISGGTTDCLLCKPDMENILSISEIGSSLDLKAGQAVDRVGIKLGLTFPCGAELEKLALKSCREYKINPVLKDNNCCLSGLENICGKMIKSGEKPCDVAKYCLSYIAETVIAMSHEVRKNYKELPKIYAGGVMSDEIIRDKILKRIENAYFASAEFSCDNAVGTALYAAIKKGLI